MSFCWEMPRATCDDSSPIALFCLTLLLCSVMLGQLELMFERHGGQERMDVMTSCMQLHLAQGVKGVH